MIEKINFHLENPNKRTLSKIAERLKEGAITIFPTDTIYALGCLMNNREGIERIIHITGKKEKQARFSLICRDISMVSDYTQPFSNSIYRIMNRVLPGPFTFIHNSNNLVQRSFKEKRKEIGIRIPDNKLTLSLLEYLDIPLISTSLNSDDTIQPFFVDPEEIGVQYKHDVDILMDGGLGDHTESTVIDCTGDDYVVVREGKGMELI